ncbi:hypothetical protein, partial [Escherichia coli]|uniref:hypothetical protein n=1 Tax=Escherichia coli TaxID=562 RepID=UPI0013705890
GLAVVSFAAAAGQRFGTVLSVSGPIRRDMQRVRRAARPFIDRWIHTCNPDDATARAGRVFDGEFGDGASELPEADLNIRLGLGHSGL